VVILSVIGNVLRVEAYGWRKRLTSIPHFDIAFDCIVRTRIERASAAKVAISLRAEG
jgi:hypothetical protein